MREKKRCLNCLRTIEEPPTIHTADYARFWRDRCPVCDGQLVQAAAPTSPATASPPQAILQPRPSRNRFQTGSRISGILAGVFAVPVIAMITLLVAKVPIERWYQLVLSAPLLLLSVFLAVVFRLNGRKWPRTFRI